MTTTCIARKVCYVLCVDGSEPTMLGTAHEHRAARACTIFGHSLRLRANDVSRIRDARLHIHQDLDVLVLLLDLISFISIRSVWTHTLHQHCTYQSPISVVDDPIHLDPACDHLRWLDLFGAKSINYSLEVLLLIAKHSFVVCFSENQPVGVERY